MAAFPQPTLITLRNLSLDMHAQSGMLITTSTIGAINGSADENVTRINMMASINAIFNDAVQIMTILNMPPSSALAAEIEKLKKG